MAGRRGPKSGGVAMSPVASAASVDTVSGAALAEGAAALRARFSRAGRPSFTERLAALHVLSEAMLARDPELLQALPATGMAFAAAFLRDTNLRHLVERELAHPAALDRFVQIDDRKSLRVLPRGVAAHWVAGNVPLLGLFSWALSALAGNVNIVRISSRTDDFLTPALRALALRSSAGADMADDTLVVRFATEDDDCHRAMSAAADVRVAWGGREAVDAITALPASWHCETVVLGPRMSLAVVDAALLSDRVLARLASDCAYFDQQACSSPQWVFVKSADDDAFDNVVRRFADAFASQARTLGRHPLDLGETYRIELDRARVLADQGTLQRDAQTAWTVAVVPAPDPRVVCANRFVQIIRCRDVIDACEHIPGNVQTVVMMLDNPDAEQFSEAAARKGVHRFARPGEGNHFESPWDGIPVFTRLTRWSVRTDPARSVESTSR
jgi:acyl-CoA reductase-like NAD-dependent aldehyde dehydrogenase